jgi:hypothetical protein
VISLHNFSSKVLNNLEDPLLSLWFLWCSLLACPCLNSTQDSDVHSLHWIKNSKITQQLSKIKKSISILHKRINIYIYNIYKHTHISFKDHK